MSITLRKLKVEELRELSAMAYIIWRQHYPGVIGPEQTTYMLKKIYSVEALQQKYEEKGETFYWICNSADKCGYLSVTPETEGILFLNKMYVMPENRKKGIGSSLFSLVEDIYPWFSQLRLTVNRRNVNAINFYFKNGFVIDHAEDFDIGEGFFMNDFVMKRNFVQKATLL